MSDTSLEIKAKKATQLIKVAMVENEIKTPELTRLLSERGVDISPGLFRNKLDRCNFKADLFLLIMEILHVDTINIK